MRREISYPLSPGGAEMAFARYCSPGAVGTGQVYQPCLIARGSGTREPCDGTATSAFDRFSAPFAMARAIPLLTAPQRDVSPLDFEHFALGLVRIGDEAALEPAAEAVLVG